MKLVKTYKDNKRIYFLLEYINGLDLDVIMRHIGLFSNHDAQFYTASIILMLQYLHERDIIYRDLKPENIIIDENGYAKLIDFGTAKILKGRTYTIVGTPHYMSPEVITGKGYKAYSDLWSLGICLYEFVCGKVPYADEEDDPYTIYEAILSEELSYPMENVDPVNLPAKELIEQLLSKVPETRCPQGYESIKRHQYFLGFGWEELSNLSFTPPYTPDVGHPSEELDLYTQIGRLSLNQENIETEETDSVNIVDLELEKFKLTIPPNWDDAF
jgi:cGMP-dependent protein kinase